MDDDEEEDDEDDIRIEIRRRGRRGICFAGLLTVEEGRWDGVIIFLERMDDFCFAFLLD